MKKMNSGLSIGRGVTSCGLRSDLTWLLCSLLPVLGAFSLGFHGPDTRAAAVPPARIGEWPGSAGGVASKSVTRGGVAYLALGSGGFEVVELTRPSAPRRMAGRSFPTETMAVSDAGNLAVLASGARWEGTRFIPGGIEVLDVSRPDAPQVLSSFAAIDSPGAVAVSGTHAWVAGFVLAGPRQLRTVDLTDPAAPRIVHVLDEPDVVSALALVGNRLFVARSPDVIPGHPPGPLTGGALRIIDVSKPAAPVVLTDVAAGPGATSLAVTGQLVLLTDGRGQLRIVDLGAAGGPAVVQTISIPYAMHVTASGQRAAVATYAQEAVLVDLAQPSTASIVRTISLARASMSLEWAGDRLAVASGEGGFEWYDVSNLAAITRLAVLPTSRYLARAAVSGRHVFMADWINGLEIVDNAKPSAPVPAGRDYFTLPGGYAVASSATRCCVASGGNLRVYDLGRPDPWTPASVVPGVHAIDDIALSGTFAAVAAQGGGLLVMDLADAERPALKGEIGLGGIVWRVRWQGSRAWCLVGSFSAAEGNLVAVELTDPAKPKAGGSVAVPDYVGHLDLGEGIAVASAGGWEDASGTWHSAKLHVFDLSEPDGPKLLSTLDMFGSISDFRVAGPLIYVAAESVRPSNPRLAPGIHVVDISNPRQPRIIGQAVAPERSYSSIALAGRYLVAAAREFGLSIFDLEPPARLGFRRISDGGVATLELSWLAGVAGLVLEQATHLDAPAWERVPGVSGNRVELSPAGAGPSARYFRLVTP